MATLIINPSDTRCGACGKSAMPSEWRHESVLGYSKEAREEGGCMELFTSLATDYTDFSGLFDSVRRMRPDLRWLGCMGRE